MCCLYCGLCPSCAWLNWAVTGRVCRGVGGVSEVGGLRRGGGREWGGRVKKRVRSRGGDRGKREEGGRQASRGGSMSALTNFFCQSLWRHWQVFFVGRCGGTTATTPKPHDNKDSKTIAPVPVGSDLWVSMSIRRWVSLKVYRESKTPWHRRCYFIFLFFMFLFFIFLWKKWSL